MSCFPVFTQILISVTSDVSVTWTAGNLQGSFLPVLSSLPKLKVGLSVEQGRMGLHSTHAVQLQAHISCLTCCLWQADLSFLPRSQLAATELISKALPTFHGSAAYEHTARLDCQHCWIYWFVLLCVMVTWLGQRFAFSLVLFFPWKMKRKKSSNILGISWFKIYVGFFFNECY